MASNSSKTKKIRKQPAHWEIYPRSLYLIHEVNASEDEGTRVELLAECLATGRLTGHYRWAFGAGNVEAAVPIGAILDVGEVFWITLNHSPHDLLIRENNCSGPWEDISDWIAKDRVGVRRENEEDAKQDLLGKS